MTLGSIVFDDADAAITIENAPLLGTLVVTATANKNFQRIFDTAALGKLGTEFGVAVRNIASVYPVVQSTTKKAKIRPIHPGNVNKTRRIVSPGLLSDRMLKYVDLS